MNKKGQMIDNISDAINALQSVRSVGITTKQIATKTGHSIDVVTKQIDFLKERGKISRIGRDLWILKEYEDINKDPDFIHPNWYIDMFKNQYERVSFVRYKQKITFSENGEKFIHRWSPYVQGFSASFVDFILTKYKIEKGNTILDPFVGSGTTLVCAKMHGADSIGVDLMSLLTFISKVKTTWDIDIEEVNKEFQIIQNNRYSSSEVEGTLIPFLKETKKQFNEDVLSNLLLLKKHILEVKSHKIRDLFLLAFISILVSSSNLKRSPCLGYVKDKKVTKDSPFIFFDTKVRQVINDLKYVQTQKEEWGDVKIYTADSKTMKYPSESIDFSVTSPPYVSGLDYVNNYKIEMAWLGKAGIGEKQEIFINDYEDLRKLRNRMIACDNISKNTIKDFSEKKHYYEDDEWLNNIISTIKRRIETKGTYRRNDMHLIVKKYFDDIYQAFQRVYEGLKDGGRFVIVIGDSLIAGTYIPTDLIIARMGKEIGFNVEDIEIARERRSGQRRNFKLRESIVTLVKGMSERKTRRLSDFI